MKILHKSKPDGSKSVIFSQWNTMLDKIEMQLRFNGFNFSRFDGQMPVGARQANLESKI